METTQWHLVHAYKHRNRDRPPTFSWKHRQTPIDLEKSDTVTTLHVSVSDERNCRCPATDTSWQSSTRYAGKRLCSALYTSMAILNWTRWQTGSQCSCCTTGVMCSHLLVLVMRRAAAFWTACRRRYRLSLIPCDTVVSCSSPGMLKWMLGLATWWHQTTPSILTDATAGVGNRPRDTWHSHASSSPDNYWQRHPDHVHCQPFVLMSPCCWHCWLSEIGNTVAECVSLNVNLLPPFCS